MKILLLLLVSIMLKTCRSGCGLVHPPPYGSKCKAVVSGAMASTLEERMAAAGRDDPKYLEYMEQEVLKSIESKAEEALNVQKPLDRLSKLEEKDSTHEELRARLDKMESARSSNTRPPPPGTAGFHTLPDTATAYYSWAFRVAGLCPATQQVGHSWAPSAVHESVGLRARSKVPTPAGIPGNIYPYPYMGPYMSPIHCDGLSHVLGESSSQPPLPNLHPGSAPAAADYVTGYLTNALQQLSIAIDPTPSSTAKGLVLWPEYYIQHVDKGVAVKSLDHNKLTYKDLVSGMGRVMHYLVSVGGDWGSYLRHFNVIMSQASRHQFLDQAFVGGMTGILLTRLSEVRLENSLQVIIWLWQLISMRVT